MHSLLEGTIVILHRLIKRIAAIRMTEIEKIMTKAIDMTRNTTTTGITAAVQVAKAVAIVVDVYVPNSIMISYDSQTRLQQA